MPRIAFQLRLRAGHEDAYDQAHRQVWPELLHELTDAGVCEYSIFRRGQELVLACMFVPDFDNFQKRMAHSEVNRRWQEFMAPLFEPVPSLALSESIALMQEVFYLPGQAPQPVPRTHPKPTPRPSPQTPAHQSPMPSPDASSRLVFPSQHALRNSR